MQIKRLFKFQEYSIKAVNDFPDNAQLYYNIGVVYYNLGYTNWAKENFEKGLALQPEDYHLNKAMGSLLLDEDAVITKKINDLSNSSANRSKKAELQEIKKATYSKILSYLQVLLYENLIKFLSKLNSKKLKKQLTQKFYHIFIKQNLLNQMIKN